MSGKKPMSRGARQALVEGLIMAVLAVLGWFYAIPKLGMFGVLWTVAAGVIALIDLYRALIKSRKIARQQEAARQAAAQAKPAEQSEEQEKP